MPGWNRRQWLTGLAAFMASGGKSRAGPARQEPDPLPLAGFEPRSMLRVPETQVPRSRFPVVDFHTHLSFVAERKNGVPLGEKVRHLAEPPEVLAVMDRKNVRTMVNLTGGVGSGLEETVAKWQKAHPGRFLVFTEPSWEKIRKPDYPRFQAAEIERAHRIGARGLKVLKTLGLFLRQDLTRGPLVKIDDPRFDPMWEVCGALRLPVAIHSSDPDAFFLATDRFNERYEELTNHPDWSFYGKDFPAKRELLEARNRVLARHPVTQFVALHVGNKPEDLGYVSECLDRFPNMHVEMGARLGELGRQPRMARRFFEKYQDRILFGTDAVPGGVETPQQIFGDQLYEIYYRFLETEDEYFDYAPAPVPPQGRWRIYGIELPETVLRKVYHENALRLLGQI